jgi:HSP20 family molecular chaperone IbpA
MANDVDVHKPDRSEVNRRPERTRDRRVFLPLTDIYETEDNIILLADMPGVGSTDLDVTLESRVLTVTGRTADYAPSGFSLVHAEYGAGDYERVFTLSDEINREAIEAKLENGVLRLKLPKVEAAKARRIAIAAG